LGKIVILILTVFKIIFPIFFLGAIGFFWEKLNKDYPVEFVTKLTMNIALPCLIFTSLMKTNIQSEILNLLIVSTLVSYFLITFLCFLFVRLKQISIPTFLSPMVFGNTGNLGLPLAFFAFGNDGLSYAVIIFAVMAIFSSTFGIWVVSGEKNLLKLLKEPIAWGALLGSLLLYFNIQTPIFLTRSLELTGQIAIPVMLITLGVSVARLRPINLSQGFIIVGYRTLVCLLIATCISLILNLPSMAKAILILQLSTPVSVTSYLISERFNRDPNEVASLVIISTLLSILYIPVILSILI
jgi:predicted permease